MDNLGLYLLVSLFFVVGMMVEFAIALVVSRNCENTVFSNENDMKDGNRRTSQYKVDMILKGKQKRVDSVDGNGFKRPSLDRRNVQPVPRVTSTMIDITASILFPVAYTIFNITYWCSLN